MSGSAALRPKMSASRSQFNRAFIADFAADWAAGGRMALMRLRRESPTNYVKLAAFLVPRQMEVEHSTGVKGMTDAQLEEAIALVRDMLEQRARKLAEPKLIEGSVDGPADC